jgi:hypothetical protein
MSDLIRLEIDEYGPAGVNGYGLNIELTPEEASQFPPLIGHFVVTILRPAAAQAHPLKNIPLARKVLTWLARYRFPDGIAFPLFDPALLTNALAERNPPGFGYPGTTDWQWYGMQIE